MIRMAKFSLGVVAVLLIGFSGSAVAQSGAISVDSVDGIVDGHPDQVIGGQDITFWLRFNNNTASKRQVSNGFKIYSENGAVWDTTIGDSFTYDGSVILSRGSFSFGYNINHYSTDGSSPDTIGFFAQGLNSLDALMPAGFNDVPVSIKVVFNDNQAPKNICIDSIAFFPPGGTWKWDNGLGMFVEPGWDGPHCYDIVNPGAVTELDDLPLPTDYALAQNYPNPFNPTTTIQFALPERAFVTVEIFNVLGQKVRTLVDEELSAGTFNEEWDGTSDGGAPLASGLYFYRLQTSTDYVETRKMVLVK